MGRKGALGKGNSVCQGTEARKRGVVGWIPAWQGLECQVQGPDWILRQQEPWRVLSRGRACKGGAGGQLGPVAAAQGRVRLRWGRRVGEEGGVEA